MRMMDAETMASKFWQYYEEARMNSENELFGIAFDAISDKVRGRLIAAMGRLIEDLDQQREVS